MDLANTYSNYCLIPSLSHEKTAAEPSSGIQHNGRITLPELQPPVRVNPTFTESPGAVDGNVEVVPYKSIRERGVVVERIGWSFKKIGVKAAIKTLSLPIKPLIGIGIGKGITDCEERIAKTRESADLSSYLADQSRVDPSVVIKEIDQFCVAGNATRVIELIRETLSSLHQGTDEKISVAADELKIIEGSRELGMLKNFALPNSGKLFDLVSMFFSIFSDLRTVVENFSKDSSGQKAYEVDAGEVSFEFDGNQYCLQGIALVFEALTLDADGSLTVKVPEVRGKISRKSDRSQQEYCRFIVDFEMTFKAPLGRGLHNLLTCDVTSIPSVLKELESKLSDVDQADVDAAAAKEVDCPAVAAEGAADVDSSNNGWPDGDSGYSDEELELDVQVDPSDVGRLDDLYTELRAETPKTVGEERHHKEDPMDDLVDFSLNHFAVLPPSSTVSSVSGDVSVELVLNALSPLLGFGLITQRDISTSEVQELEKKKRAYQEELEVLEPLIDCVTSRQVDDKDSYNYYALPLSRELLYNRLEIVRYNLEKTNRAIRDLACNLAIPWFQPDTGADFIHRSLNNVSRLIFGFRHAFGPCQQSVPIEIEDQIIPMGESLILTVFSGFALQGIPHSNKFRLAL